MKTSKCLHIILLSFFAAFGQESGTGMNQHFWLLDCFEFPDARFISNTFTEPNMNKLTFIIDSKAYAGAGIEYGNFDENLKANFNNGSKEIFYLKNRCYLDFSKLTNQLPGLFKLFLPSGCHVGILCQRDRFSIKKNNFDSPNVPAETPVYSISNFGITPDFFLYWVFSKSFVNYIRIGTQRTFHRYDKTNEEMQFQWPDYFEYFFDMYLGKNDNTRNLFRLTCNTINVEEDFFKFKTDYFCLEYEFQHDFKFNFSVNMGVKAEYQLYKIPLSFDDGDVEFKYHYIELMPHLSIDYTFPVFLNTISFSLFAPRIFNWGLGYENDNTWADWDKYWSASVYITMPFWSKPLNIKTAP